MRGAAFLASLQSDISKESALVVDIGGTTVRPCSLPFLGLYNGCNSQTDIGMLLFVFTLTESNILGSDTPV